METASFDHESLLAELISLWQRRRAEGKAATPAELCRERPELLPALERQIAALERMDALAEAAHEALSVPPQRKETNGIREPSTIDPYPTLPPTSQELQAAPPLKGLPDGPVVPGYEVLGVLGKGGMGIVYKARQKG